MKHIKVLGFLAAALLSALASTGLHAAPQTAEASREKVVIQVSDSLPEKWNLALNNAKNVQASIGKDNVDVEIVAFGPGIEMLKKGSEVGNKVDKALNDGVAIVACENTMKNFKLSQPDMLPSIGFVPSGAVEIMRKQKQGWAYIRP